MFSALLAAIRLILERKDRRDDKNAPDVSRELAVLAERSYENLSHLVTQVQEARARGPAALDALAADLLAQTADVLQAVESLRVYITSTFPAYG